MDNQSIDAFCEQLCQSKIEENQFRDEVLRILFGEKPEETLENLNVTLAGQSKGSCFGLIKGSTFIFCRTCSIGRTCMCEPCFKRGNHQGHFYTIEPLEGFSYCDCGDSAVIRPEGFCPNHDDKVPRNVSDDFPKDLLLKIQTNLEKLMIKSVVILESIAEVKENWNNEQAKAPAYTIINFLCHLCTENVHIRLIVLQLLIGTKKSSVMLKHVCDDLDQLSFSDTAQECHCSFLEVLCRYSFLIEEDEVSNSLTQILIFGIRLTDNRHKFFDTILKMAKFYIQIDDSKTDLVFKKSQICLSIYQLSSNIEEDTQFILNSKYSDYFGERIRILYANHFETLPISFHDFALWFFISFGLSMISKSQTKESINMISKTQILETIVFICYQLSIHNKLPFKTEESTNSELLQFRELTFLNFIRALKSIREKAEIGGLDLIENFEKIMLRYLKKYFDSTKEEEMNPVNILLQVFGLLFIQNRISQDFDWADIYKIKENPDIAEILPNLVSNSIRYLGFYSEVINEFWVQYSLHPSDMHRFENVRGVIDIDITPLQIYISCLCDSPTDTFQMMVSHFSSFLQKEWLERPELISKTDTKEYNLFVDFLGLIVRLVVDVTSITKLTFEDAFLEQKCLENPILLERVNLGVVYILQTFGTLQNEVIGDMIPPCCETVAPYICDDDNLIKSRLKKKYKDVCETFIFEKHKKSRSIVADQIAKNQGKTFDTIIGKPPSHKDVLALRLIGTLINSSLVGCVTQIILSLQQIEDKHEVIRCAVKLYYTFLDALPDLAAVPNVDLSRIISLLVNEEITHSLSESLSYKPLKWLTPQLQRLLDKIREMAVTLGISGVLAYLEKEKDSLGTLERQESSSIVASKRKKEEMQAAFRARQEQLMRRPSHFEEKVLNEEREVCGICRESLERSNDKIGFTLRVFPHNDIIFFERRMREKFKSLFCTPYTKGVRNGELLIVAGCFHKFHVKCFEDYKADYISLQTEEYMKSLCPCPACKRLVETLQPFSESKIKRNIVKTDSLQALKAIIRKDESKRHLARKSSNMSKAFLPLVFTRVQKSSQKFLQLNDEISKVDDQFFLSKFSHLKYSLMWQDGLDFSNFIKEKVKLYQGYGIAFNTENVQEANILFELKIECLRILSSLSLEEHSEADVMDRLEQQWCLFSPSNNFGRYSLRPFDPIDYKDILANNLHELYTYFMVSILSFQPDLDIPSVNSVLLSRLYGLFALQNFISHCRLHNHPIQQFEEFEKFIAAYDNKKEVESRFLKYLRTAVVIQLVFGPSDPELEQILNSNEFMTEQEELDYLSKVCGLTPLLQVIQEMKQVLINKLEAHLSDTKNTSSKAMKMLLSRDVWVCDFLTLPERYDEFLKTYSGKPCALCDSTDASSFFTLCLMCGQIFCPTHCPTDEVQEKTNYAKHIESQHGSCGVLVYVRTGSTIMIDKLYVYDSVDLYTNNFGRSPNQGVKFYDTSTADFYKYKLNHTTLEKVRDIYFRSLIPDSVPQ